MAIRVSKREDGTLMVHFGQTKEDVYEMANHLIESGETLGHPLGSLMLDFFNTVSSDTTYEAITSAELDPNTETGHFTVSDSDSGTIVVSVENISEYYSRRRTLSDAYESLEEEDPAVRRNKRYRARQDEKRDVLYGLRDRLLRFQASTHTGQELTSFLADMTYLVKRATHLSPLPPHPEDLKGPKTEGAGPCCQD